MLYTLNIAVADVRYPNLLSPQKQKLDFQIGCQDLDLIIYPMVRFHEEVMSLGS